MIEEIINDYKAGNPTRVNSRDLVRQIATAHGLSKAKVRSVLIGAGAYVSLPKNKSKIDMSDYNALFTSFSNYQGEGGSIHYGPDALVNVNALELGYSKWALSNFYLEWCKLGRPSNLKQFNLYQRRREEDQTAAFRREMEEISSASNSSVETRNMTFTQMNRMVKKSVKDNDPHRGWSIFHPEVAS